MPFNNQNKSLLLLLVLSLGYFNQAPPQESIEESIEEESIPFLESRGVNSFIMTQSEEKLEEYWKMTASETNKNTDTQTNSYTETLTEQIQEINKMRNLNSVLLILRQQQRLKR